MKLLISDTPPNFLNLDAPTLSAEPVADDDGVVVWRVWCKHCQVWHCRGPSDGHREGHCRDRDSPYWGCGYNLAGVRKHLKTSTTAEQILIVPIRNIGDDNYR